MCSLAIRSHYLETSMAMLVMLVNVVDMYTMKFYCFLQELLCTNVVYFLSVGYVF